MDNSYNLTRNDNNYTLISLLLITISFLIFEILEIFSILKLLLYHNELGADLFEKCYKNSTMYKLFICFYSSLSIILSLVLVVLCLINVDFFFKKVITSFIYVIYFFFGPFLMMISFLAIYNSKETMMFCDDKYNLYYSKQILMNTICFFLFGTFITITFSLYKGVHKVIDSVVYKEHNGNILIKMFFWKIVN